MGTWPSHPSADPRGPPSRGLVPCRCCEDAGRWPRTHFFVIKLTREDARLLAAIFIPLRTKAASSLLKLLTFSQSFLRPTHVLSGAPHPCFPDIFRILGGFPLSHRFCPFSGSVMGASSTHSMFGGRAGPLQRGRLWVRAEGQGQGGSGVGARCSGLGCEHQAGSQQGEQIRRLVGCPVKFGHAEKLEL